MPVRKSIAVSYGLTLTSTAVFVATSVVINRILKPEQIGVYALGMAVYGILMAIQQVGVSTYIIREKELTDAKLGSAASVALMQGGFLFTTMMLLAGPIARYQRLPELETVIRILAVGALFWTAQPIFGGLLSRHQRFAAHGLMSTIGSFINGPVSIILALQGFGPVGLAWAMLAGLVATAALGAVMAGRLQRLALSLKHLREILRFGVITMFMGLLFALQARLVPFMIGRLMGAFSVGQYTRATSMIELFTSNLLAPMTQPFLSSLARSYAESADAFHWSILRYHRVGAATYMAIFALVAVMAGPGLNLLFGAQWQPAQGPLSILAVAQMAISAALGAWEVATISDKRGAYIRIAVAQTIALLGVISWTYQFGLTAIALATLAVTCLTSAAHLMVMARLFGLRLRTLLAQAADGAIIAAASVLPCLVYMQVQGWPYAAPFWHMVLLGLSWAVGLLIACRLRRHELWDEFIRVYGALRGRFGWLPDLG